LDLEILEASNLVYKSVESDESDESLPLVECDRHYHERAVPALTTQTDPGRSRCYRDGILERRTLKARRHGSSPNFESELSTISRPEWYFERPPLEVVHRKLQ
jgi:hypothetical protein